MSLNLRAQTAWFIDGYHGGVYGHYPAGFTNFILGKLKEHPDWKINLEIEPETWDSVKAREPASLAALQQFFSGAEGKKRIDFVSPAYGQSYFYNISGESIIRHFYYGIKKTRQYFPSAEFNTYSSEEPCFTSALPQILKSFGYRYASLKNPNTCWGGYTNSFDAGIVNWIGPDGTGISTVPRYSSEGLLPNSTWQTEAWINSEKYIKDAFRAGIRNPVAMTLQDAGWKNGPWIGAGKGYQPTIYTTWTDYFRKHSNKARLPAWRFSQEDMLVSLVWGSQVLQQIAQRVRIAENKIVQAEKIAALASIQKASPWPGTSLDEAWRSLMLSQHHDCWIVPYNGTPGDTWADKVKAWTTATDAISDSIISASHVNKTSQQSKTTPGLNAGDESFFRIYNTTGSARTEVAEIVIPPAFRGGPLTVINNRGHELISQKLQSSKDSIILVKLPVSSYGFTTVKLVQKSPASPGSGGASASFLSAGRLLMETDLYRLVVDSSQGGCITNLVSKADGNRGFVEPGSGFNTMRGNFFNDGGLRTSYESPVTVSLLEKGPLLISAEIRGLIAGHPFVQTITLKQGQRRIDCSLLINWQQNIGIGDDYKQQGGLDAKDYRKPFYANSAKLLLKFPTNLVRQKIFKDAPYDVTESRLPHTFFNSWDKIRNDIVLNWVDCFSSSEGFGLAMITDHTTTYGHHESISANGKSFFPLALTVQYSGAGLWGRNHTITGPTSIRYSLLPHKGRWDSAGISGESVNFNEPLISLAAENGNDSVSLIDLSGTGYQLVTSLIDGKDLLLRIFNADGDDKPMKLRIEMQFKGASLEELDGRIKQQLDTRKTNSGNELMISMPRFGIRTIRLKGVHR